ncbi:VOC family protein [Sphingomonas sp. SUN039]|uniref:VOC family protein n=1 Tax=Sphingomonas sp. SUN039 TaxID=2937787 RepID=UPI002164C927|nr:VOC family protein [Sphingomonas sp. SUN039]UVO53126.1 VOC family protein [Sphingomonas sp. SUN039]
MKLGHVNIRAISLEATVAWYERVLGLRRSVADTNPDTAVNLWLYDAGGSPCVHVNQLLPGDVRTAKGHVDHFAFDVEDRAAMEAHLAALNEPWETVPFPHARMVQFNLRDPNGVKVELTFREQD